MNDNLKGRIALHVPKLDTMARYHRDLVAGESAQIIRLLELEVAALETALRLTRGPEALGGLQRYEIGEAYGYPSMIVDVKGDWVKFEDLAKLEGEQCKREQL